MPHPVRLPPARFFIADGRASVRAVPAAADNLIWELRCEQTGEVAVIDGPDAAGVDPRVTVILNTHTHGDHIGINRDLLPTGQIARVYGCPDAASAVPGLTHPVDDGDRVMVGALVGEVLRTDGHLRGHVCYRFAEALFCGDTLFAGGCGYLFDGPPWAMWHSLLRLAALPPSTLVCCAHEYTLDNLLFARFVEPDNAAVASAITDAEARLAVGETTLPSTIGRERATNPFLRPGSPTILRRLREAGLAHDPRDPLSVFTALRAWKNARPHRAPTP